MKYKNVRRVRLTHEEIARCFGYSNVNSFRSSSAHGRIMKGVDELVDIVINRTRKI